MFPTNAFESKESCDGGCCTRRRMAAFTIQAARARIAGPWTAGGILTVLIDSGQVCAALLMTLSCTTITFRDWVWSRARVAGYFVRESWSGRAGQGGAVASGAARRRHAQPSLLTVPLLFGLLAVELWQSSPAPAWLCLWQPQRGSTPAALVAATLRHRSAPARPHPPPRRSDRRGEPSGPAPAHPTLALPSPRPRARGLPSPCSSTGLDAGSSGIPARPPAAPCAPLLARARRAAIAAHAFARIATQAVEG